MPVEFTREYVEQNSPVEAQLYTKFLTSGEPYRSLMQPNFHTSARTGFAHDPKTAPATSAVPGLDLDDVGKATPAQ